jgi:mannose-6-phosphate isomerase-like protein (cupin superfamily)
MAETTDHPSPRTTFAYDLWMESQHVPIYRGHFVPDMRTLPLGRWDERGCDAAFVQLTGQEGVSEARITEVPPGETLPPYKMAVDEMVYVVSGSGSATVWANGDSPAGGHQFEWDDKALFMIPPNHYRQFSNLTGDRPVRLLHYDYLPLAMSIIPDPAFFLDNPYRPAVVAAELESAYSTATMIQGGQGLRWIASRNANVAYWYGNFFPDMSGWDSLDSNASRGAGGRTVRIQFAGSDMSCHMSVFDAMTYKKAHRHGPGRVIVIPSGEGYSMLWLNPEDEPVVVPWQEAALFVPPDRWFHQHFNLGAESARYLALHPPLQFHGYAERAEDRKRDQIEYPDEPAAVRARFEAELAKRDRTSLMPAEAYRSKADAWA